jgi:chromosome segregation ATPase
MGDDGTEECERLEQEAQKAHELLQECRARRRQLLDEIKSLKKTVKSLEVQLPKLQMEITGCDTTREELTKLIPQLRTQCQFSAEDAAKKAGLEKNVQKCKSDMASCAELAAKLEKEVARLQKAILEAGGSRLKKQKAACEQALSDLNATEKALRSAKVEVGSTEKAAAKANAAKAAFEAELAQCEEMLTEKETEFQSLEVGAMEVMQAFEQVKGVEAEKRVSLEGASKESEELKKSQSEIKCIEIDLLGKIEAFEKQISELKRKVHHWEKEISRLQVVEDECEFDDDEDDESVNEADETENEDGESEPSSENGDVEMEDAEEAAPADNSENMPPATEPKRSSLPKLSHATLDKYDTEEIKDAIGVLETERNTLAKNANMGAIAEYRKKEGDYLSR